MKTWADFYDYYLAQIPGCTYFTAQNAVRQAAQEFCERSLIWRATLDPVTTVAGISVYDFDLPSTQELVKLISATLDDQHIEVLDQDNAEVPCIHGILALNPREFMLLPDPDPGVLLVAKAAIKPSNTATGVEDWIFAQFAKQIAAGAKAMLQEEVGAPYSDPASAQLNRTRFDDSIAAARLRAQKGFSRAPLRVRASFM